MPDLVFFRAYPNRFEAELAQQYLADHGIETLVQADDGGGMYAGLSLGRKGVRLLVRPEDAEAAIEILDSDDGFGDDVDVELDDADVDDHAPD